MEYGWTGRERRVVAPDFIFCLTMDFTAIAGSRKVRWADVCAACVTPLMY